MVAPTRPKIRWMGAQASAQIKMAANRGLQKAAASLRGTIVRRLSKSAHAGGGARSPGPGARRPRRFSHSKAGEPPRAVDGKLRQSIFWSHDAGRLLASVGTRVKHGVYMELGTKPHVINPKRKKMLVFGGWVLKQAEYTSSGKVKKGAGMRSSWDWVFSRGVQHPGTKPRPYMLSTLRMQRDVLMKIIADEIKKKAGVGLGVTGIGR